MEFNATFIAAMVSFVIFILIMNQIYYKPISNVVNERNKIIDDNYKDAMNSKEKTDSIHKEKDSRLNETTKQAKEIVNTKVNEAHNKSIEITDNAKKQYADETDRAKNNLLTEEEDINKVLSENIDELAGHISSKILGDNV